MPAGVLAKNAQKRKQVFLRERHRQQWSFAWLFLLFSLLLVAAHASLLRLPYYWDECGYYIPAARDLLAGSLIPHTTPSNAHPPLVMAWLALAWRIFGQAPAVTRSAMLLVAAFSLTGFFRLARAVSNATVAAASTFLVAIYPVFFAQSSLAHVDLAAAGLAFWGLGSYVSERRAGMAIWFTLAAMAKETAILVPLALFVWEMGHRVWDVLLPRMRTIRLPLLQFPNLGGTKIAGPQTPPFVSAPGSLRYTKDLKHLSLLLPALPLILWYAYHYARTGFVFGNADFFRYNLQENLRPLRIFLALLLRIWQTVGYLNLYVLALACLLAMRFPAPVLDRRKRSVVPEEKGTITDDRRPASEDREPRPRIAVPVQLAFLTIFIVYLLAMSVLGGAVLARYMLPVVPLFILICVSTIWRRLKAWKPVLVIVALSFMAAIFLNPPYGFSLEDNLAYSDYIRLHQRAEAFIASHHPAARVLTAWPASDELSRPYLGYVQKPLPVVRIEDFTPEQLLSAANARSRFEVALVFSTKYQPPRAVFDRWRMWQEWKTRYFDYHLDMTPEAAAAVLSGNLVYAERRAGQWVGVIELEKIEEARSETRTAGLRPQVPSSRFVVLPYSTRFMQRF
jgi:hypothetical protein